MTKLPQVLVSVNAVVPVLSVSPVQEDHEVLEGILNGSESNWDVVKTDTLPSALSLLRERWFPIVICERDMAGGGWKSVLEDPGGGLGPTSVIVTSRLADEQLWAEALNLGAYDVLAKPFDRQEVYRVVDSAWRHWTNSHSDGRSPARPVAADWHKTAVAAAIRNFAGPDQP